MRWYIADRRYLPISVTTEWQDLEDPAGGRLDFRPNDPTDLYGPYRIGLE